MQHRLPLTTYLMGLTSPSSLNHTVEPATDIPNQSLALCLGTSPWGILVFQSNTPSPTRHLSPCTWKTRSMRHMGTTCSRCLVPWTSNQPLPLLSSMDPWNNLWVHCQHSHLVPSQGHNANCIVHRRWNHHSTQSHPRPPTSFSHSTPCTTQQQPTWCPLTTGQIFQNATLPSPTPTIPPGFETISPPQASVPRVDSNAPLCTNESNNASPAPVARVPSLQFSS